jgi:hypothetical protein
MGPSAQSFEKHWGFLSKLLDQFDNPKCVTSNFVVASFY